MELIAKIKIDNIYKSKDFKDKKSGEVTPGKWKIQTFEKFESEEGEQMKLLDISIPQETYELIKNKTGEVANIRIGTFVSNGKVGYYGI